MNEEHEPKTCPCCGASMHDKPDKQITCSRGCANTMFKSGPNNGAYKGGRSPVLTRYREMIGRCHDEDHKHFKNYGSRGIHVCDRWRFGDGTDDGIGCFIADMGLPPIGMSLDRINNDGPYSLDNCRWCTAAVQNTNTRRNVYYEVDGQSKTAGEWAEIYGISRETVRTRLKRGYGILDALSLCRISKKASCTYGCSA